MFTVAIIGSRNFNKDQYNYIWEEKLSPILNTFYIDKIISGGANGADQFAKYCAEMINTQRQSIEQNGYCSYNDIIFDEESYLANWEKHGKSAGAIRNQKIVDDANLIIAIWDGKSKGTLDTIRKARINKKDLFIFFI